MTRRLPAYLDKPELLRRNARFATYSATFNGRRAFVKQAAHPGLQSAIAAELFGLRAFGELDKAGVLNFKVPKILTYDRDLIVTSWAVGSVMPTATMGADTFAAIDLATSTSNPVASSFELPTGRQRNEANRLASRLRAVDTTAFQQTLIERALVVVARDISLLSARLTHGDLTPHNVLQTRASMTVIDYESVSLLWPRFYDIVNYTHNAVVIDASHATAMLEVLENFFALIGEPITKHRRTINAIALVRSLSSIYEYGSLPNNEHSNEDALTDERIETITRFLSRGVRGRLFLG